MKAVILKDFGDSSQLSYEDAPIPEPGEGEVREPPFLPAELSRVLLEGLEPPNFIAFFHNFPASVSS